MAQLNPVDWLAGWDVFGLDYRVAEPVASLLGEGPLRGYGRLFQLLWSLQVPDIHTLCLPCVDCIDAGL